MAQKINALTATRGFAAILVIVHHFGRTIFPFNHIGELSHCGNVAVSYFFVLSGFVLYVSYRDRQVPYGAYIKKRLARIYPVYLLAMLLLAVDLYWIYGGLDYKTAKEMTLSAFLLQAYIPNYPLSFNTPAWTISIEMFFYLLFPLLLYIQNRKIKVFMLLSITLYILSQAIHLWGFRLGNTISNNLSDVINFNPVMHVSTFLMGMIAGYLFGKVKERRPRYSWASLALLLIIILCILYRPVDISYQVGLLAPLFMLFILTTAISNPSFLNFRPLVFLGEISYGVYILQMPVFIFCRFVDKGHLHLSSLWEFYGSLVVLLFLSTLSYIYVELPIMRKIGRGRHIIGK